MTDRISHDVGETNLEGSSIVDHAGTAVYSDYQHQQQEEGGWFHVGGGEMAASEEGGEVSYQGVEGEDAGASAAAGSPDVDTAAYETEGAEGRKGRAMLFTNAELGDEAALFETEGGEWGEQQTGLHDVNSQMSALEGEHQRTVDNEEGDGADIKTSGFQNSPELSPVATPHRNTNARNGNDTAAVTKKPKRPGGSSADDALQSENKTGSDSDDDSSDEESRAVVVVRHLEAEEVLTAERKFEEFCRTEQQIFRHRNEEHHFAWRETCWKRVQVLRVPGMVVFDHRRYAFFLPNDVRCVAVRSNGW